MNNENQAKSSDIWRRDVISWALYDFANTIYSMNIVSLYFAAWLVIDLGYKDIHYSLAYSVSMFLAAILMPALGYFSDRSEPDQKGWRSQKKLAFLAAFTTGAVLAVIVFAILPSNLIFLILVFFAISNFFFEGGMVFYNALLDSVSSKENVGKISGFGVSLGYLGSIIGMALVDPFVSGGVFGFNLPFIEGAGRHAAYIPTALLYALFALPIFLFVREKKKINKLPVNTEKSGLVQAYKSVWECMRSTRKYPGMLRFLISDYFFEDAIATVVLFMAVFNDRDLNLKSSSMIIFFFVSTVFAMIGAYLLGHLADKKSHKKTLHWIVAGWIISLLVFSVNSYTVVFWIFGPIVGILLGGVWAVSRPILIQLSPPEKLGEFFGLFSISGRAAAIVGPLIWGGVVYLFSSDQRAGIWLSGILGLDAAAAVKLPYRLAVISLSLLMAIGLYLFRKVPDKKGDNR